MYEDCPVGVTLNVEAEPFKHKFCCAVAGWVVMERLDFALTHIRYAVPVVTAELFALYDKLLSLGIQCIPPVQAL